MSTAPDRAAWSLMLELFMSHHRPRIWAIASEFELTPMQMLALKSLEPGRELPMSALADSLHCDASNVTGIVDRLESRALLERRSSPEDRRVKVLAVTEEGQRLRERIAERMGEPPAALVDLDEADKRALRDILQRALGR
jgi:DNA-binding MarR family transcriptional regulator